MNNLTGICIYNYAFLSQSASRNCTPFLQAGTPEVCVSVAFSNTDQPLRTKLLGCKLVFRQHNALNEWGYPRGGGVDGGPGKILRTECHDET